MVTALPTPAPEWMNVQQAAIYTHHSKRYLDNARAGFCDGPHFHQRKRCCTVLYRRVDLDAWLAQDRREPPPRKRKAVEA